MLDEDQFISILRTPSIENIKYALNEYETELRYASDQTNLSIAWIRNLIHNNRLRLNFILYCYLIGVRGNSLKLHCDKLEDLKFEFVGILPNGSDVMYVINAIHRICNYECRALDNALDRRKGDENERYEDETIYINSMCPEIFFDNYGEIGIMYTINMYKKARTRNFISSWFDKPLSADHFLIWAYMGNNLVVKSNLFSKAQKRPHRKESDGLTTLME